MDINRKLDELLSESSPFPGGISIEEWNAIIEKVLHALDSKYERVDISQFNEFVLINTNRENEEDALDLMRAASYLGSGRFIAINIINGYELVNQELLTELGINSENETVDGIQDYLASIDILYYPNMKGEKDQELKDVEFKDEFGKPDDLLIGLIKDETQV